MVPWVALSVITLGAVISITVDYGSFLMWVTRLFYFGMLVSFIVWCVHLVQQLRRVHVIRPNIEVNSSNIGRIDSAIVDWAAMVVSNRLLLTLWVLMQESTMLYYIYNQWLVTFPVLVQLVYFSACLTIIYTSVEQFIFILGIRIHAGNCLAQI